MAKLGMGAKSTAKKIRRSKAKNVLSKKQAKAVQSIAKKVVANEEETKFFQYSNGVTYPSVTAMTSWNIFYQNVAQGDNNNQMTGDKIHWRGLKVKYFLTNYGGAIRGWLNTPFTVTFMLVATKAYQTTGSITLSDIRDDTNATFENYFVNNDTKILFKREIKMNQVKTGDKKHVTGSFWIKKNQKIQYKDFSASYQLAGEWQYYLVTYAWDDNINLITDPPASCGQLVFSYKNYFKDA